MRKNLNNINNHIISKKIFIYPTDTIYGIGCNAENKKLVEKIRRIKKRDKKPFSIIVPNKAYILKHFQTNKKIKKNIKKYLPGPYTLILKKKDKSFLTHVSNTDSIGIRIPNHPFTKTLQKTKKPIVTTSVNLSGEKPANKINDIDKNILKKVDLIIDRGPLSGKPSIIIKDDEVIKR